jgi:uncharacterized membrane protein YcaP (DUF421 family)
MKRHVRCRGMDLIRSLIGPDEGNATALQLSIRAVILLFFGIACIRLAGRRTFSQLSPLDVIVAVIVGSNLSRAMTGKAPFFPGLTATFVLVVLHRLLAMASIRWGFLANVIKCAPSVLIAKGSVDEAALRRHGLSQGDLLEGLRLKNVARIEEVELATLEGGGQISVVPAKRN